MKNKNWLTYVVIGLIIIIITITIIIITRNVLEPKAQNLSDKIADDLDYLNRTTFSMINQLNNLKTTDEIQISRTSVESPSKSDSNSSNEKSGEEGKSGSSEDNSGQNAQSKNIEKYQLEDNAVLLRDSNKIDWDSLEVQAESLYDSWITITLDLNSMNVSSEDILSYNTNLDNLLMSIKNKDKVNSAICLANMYSLIPKYMSETLDDDSKLKVEIIKSNIISAYSLVETNKWDDVLNLLGKAETGLTTFMNSINSLPYTKQSKINKAYVLLKELIKSSNEKNSDLFYLKYINLIQELENI